MRNNILSGYIMAQGSNDRYHIITADDGEAVTTLCGETMTGLLDVRTSMSKGSVCPICITVIRMKNRGDV